MAIPRIFIGESHHKVDAKGRVSIPSPYRAVLQEGDPDWTEGLRPHFVIVYGDQSMKYLECYTIRAHTDLAEDILNLQRGDMGRKMLERLYIGQSCLAEVDGDGRIVLPQKLREKIDIDGEAFFIATGESFQIWKPETYETEELAKTRAWLSDKPEDFDPRILLDQARG